jgi:serine protease Do
LEDVKEATIRIEAQGSFVNPTGEQTNYAGGGSGFIIDPSGIAVTNNHVVAGAALLRVWVGEESQPRNAKIIGVSECSDLAVIDLDGDDYTYLEWYDGDVAAGLDVYTAGFPLGDPEFTLTRGIVSKGRANGETRWASVDAVIEHDATINPGSSGGPLVTADGQVVAVNYASRSDTNQYFAIARDEALEIIEQLLTPMDIDSIGVNPQAVSFDSGESGIWAASVRSGSPADRAALEAGDVILQLEGLDLATDGTMADYCDILRSHKPEDQLDIQVLRLSTGEILEGQINGPPLGEGASTVVPTVAPTAVPTRPAQTYVSIEDDLQAITMQVPRAWNDIDGSPYKDSDGNAIAAALVASSDVNAFRSYGAPGVYFMAMPLEPGQFDAPGLLDEFDQRAACTYEGRHDYSDQLYTGSYDEYSDCGDSGSGFVVIVAAPESQDFFTMVMVNVMSPADLDAIERILDSFEVIGDLPGEGGGSSDTFTLILENKSPDPVCHLYITDSDTLGDDWLQSEQLEPNKGLSIDLPVSEYVVVAQDCQESYMGVFFDITEDAVLTIGGPGRTVSIRAKNQTGGDICGIYISATTQETWGENWLGDAIVQDGQEWIFYVAPGDYDLLVQDCEGADIRQVEGIAFTSDKLWTITREE